MEEIKRRTLVVRIFPNAASCLRLVPALAVEMDENWIEAMQYLNMEPLAEQKKRSTPAIGRCGLRSLQELSRGKGPQSPALALHPIPRFLDG